MTAPALNPAQLAVPGAAISAAASAKTPGPLAGFQALMAALFPEPGVEVADAAAKAQPVSLNSTASLQAFAAAAGDDVELASDPAGADAGRDTDGEAAATAVGADAIAQTSVPTPPAPPVLPSAGAIGAPPEVAAETTDADAPIESPIPHGARRSPIAERFAKAADPAAAPAAPAATGDAEVGDTETGEDTQEPAAHATGRPETLPKLPESAARPAQPPAWGTHKLAAGPAAPAIENANAHAKLTEKTQAPPAEEQPGEPPTSTPAASAAESATAPAVPTFATKPPPPAPTANAARPAKGERGKSASEGVADVTGRPTEAVDKPVHARASEPANLAADAVEAVDAKATESRPAADAPDATVQAEARAAETASAPAVETASRQVRGAPETVANLAAQIVKKLEARTTRFDVELDPHGLGKVDVRVEIHAHGRITAAMTFDNPQAAQDVKARAAELQRALEQAGFDLSGSALTFDVAQDHGRGQGHAWQDQSDNGSAFRGQAFRAALETAGDAAEAANQGALRLRRGVSSGLDLRI